MLTSISLERFKCFEKLYMPLKPLTLIAGANGAGKSSIIQTLLMLRQSCLDKDYNWSDHIVINGRLVDLDDASTLLYASSNNGENHFSVTLEYDEDKEIEFVVDPKPGEATPCTTKGDLDKAKKECSLFADSFSYLYADRAEPQKEYTWVSSPRKYTRLGDRKGTNTAFVYANAINNNQQIAIETLKNANAIDESVLRNVSAWIGYIMGDSVDVKATETEKSQKATIDYTIYNKDNASQKLSPLNMPFGHSYILPIVLGILTAPAGSLFIVENPESHLHPSAQLRMGGLLSLAANAGVQVIIETHSDHLMNGIRLACHDGHLNAEHVEMDLVGIENDGYTHFRKPVKLNQDGSIDNWIPGFFDEWENALMGLME